MKKILFLANIQHGEEPTGGGVQTRNQNMLHWLKQKYDIIFYDTWKKSHITSIFLSLYLSIKNCDREIIISYGGRGALLLMKLLNYTHNKGKIKFFVPGGDFLNIVKLKDIKYWSCFDEILVQSKYLMKELNKIGLCNVTYCPNFKSIKYRPKHNQYCLGNPLRFVYVGRLIEEKGIQVMINACKKINENFILTIYGKETMKYSKDFFRQLGDKRILYKGFLNLKKHDGYDELSSHDVLIFPTFFEGEGFSGTLIDAFICGLPVIATDFNVNSEIVLDGVTGLIIPPNNVEALSSVMRKMINGEYNINQMSACAYKSANSFDIDIVMGQIFD